MNAHRRKSINLTSNTYLHYSNSITLTLKYFSRLGEFFFSFRCKAPISSQPLQLLLHPDFHLAWLRSSIRVWSSGTPLVISPRFRVYSYSTRRRVRLSSLTGLTRAMVMREGSRVAPTTWSCVRWLKATIPMVVPFLIKF